MVVLSMVSAICALVGGCRIIYTQQELPEFMKDVDAVIGLISFATVGLPAYFTTHLATPATWASSILVVVAINVALTAFLEAHDAVASSAMLWFTEEEDHEKPRYNTNSRLLTGTKRFGMYSTYAPAQKLT